jgi:hypothetical protein
MSVHVISPLYLGVRFPNDRFVICQKISTGVKAIVMPGKRAFFPGETRNIASEILKPDSKRKPDENR